MTFHSLIQQIILWLIEYLCVAIVHNMKCLMHSPPDDGTQCSCVYTHYFRVCMTILCLGEVEALHKGKVWLCVHSQPSQHSWQSV